MAIPYSSFPIEIPLFSSGTRISTIELSYPEAQPLLQISALGSERIEQGQRIILPSEWGYTKVRELLFYLLCYRSRTKEQIGLALWPDASPSQLRNHLHDTLRQLRRTLAESRWVLYEQRRYRFNRQFPYWFDIECFERLVKQAREQWKDDPARAIAELREACTLYQGDFLADMPASEWVQEHRYELQLLYQEALLLLGHLYVAQKHYTQAIEIYRKSLALDRYQEKVHRQLMRCYIRRGERSRALHHYQCFAQWLQTELGSSPAAETRALFERLRQGNEL